MTKKQFFLLFISALVFTPMTLASPNSHTQLKLLDTAAEFAGANLSNVQFVGGPELQAELVGAKIGRLETAPIIAPTFNTAIVSWNASTPTGTNLFIELRARIAGRWTHYYRLAIWGSTKHSFEDPADTDGRMNTDTLELKKFADAIQVRLTFETNNNSTPTLNLLAVLTSDAKQHSLASATASNKKMWGTELPVPQHSQMLYPGGGEVWCSPTSVTMLLGYWGAKFKTQIADTVPVAAHTVWDSVYDGAGNWPFNTAYAASKNKNLRAYVNRLNNLFEAENYIGRGIPLAMSVGWGIGELQNAHMQKSNGHLVVLRGFTKMGDPIINDPAAKSDAGVRTIYKRNEFERAWVGHSGGIVYVIEAR